MKDVFKPNFTKIILWIIVLFLISLIPLIPAKECIEGNNSCKYIMPLFSFSTGFYIGDFSPYFYLGILGIILVTLEIIISYILACLIVSKIKK